MKKTERLARDLENSVVMGVGTARNWAAPRIQDGVQRAANGISGGIAVVTPKLQDGLERVAHAVDTTTPRIQHTLDRAAPAITHARDRVVVEYIPAMSNRLSDAAESASRTLAAATMPAGLTAVVTKVTGDKKATRKAQKAAVEAAKKAAKQLKRRQRNDNKGWLIFGIIAAAITAGVAVWRASKPVEDPWKTPAPVDVKTAPVTLEKSEEAKDVVTDARAAAEAAKEAGN